MVQQTILISLPITELHSVIRNAVTEAIQEQHPQIFVQEEENEYYTRKQTANQLHISLGTLDSYCKSGILKAYKIGHRVLFKKSEIDQSLLQIKRLKNKTKIKER